MNVKLGEESTSTYIQQLLTCSIFIYFYIKLERYHVHLKNKL